MIKKEKYSEEMEKKEYLTPEMDAVELKLTTVICVSGDFSDDGDPVGKDPDPDYSLYD